MGKAGKKPRGGTGADDGAGLIEHHRPDHHHDPRKKKHLTLAELNEEVCQLREELKQQKEKNMAAIQDVLDKLKALDDAILALPKPAPPLATQEQIDAAAAAADKAIADLPKPV